MSLRDTILNAADVPEELVPVPEWGAKVLVRGLTAGEQADFYTRVSTIDPRSGEVTVNRKHWAAEIIIACCYDPETKSKLFEAADRDTLNKKAAKATDRLSSVAARLSGLGDDRQDMEIAKGFE